LLDRSKNFDEMLWPHLRAAYNVARWLVRNDQDAEDIVQESFVKAFLALDRFRGGDARVWLLAIVRNTAMSLLRGRRPELAIAGEDMAEPQDTSEGVEARLISGERRERVRTAIERLPGEFRETLILRELEGLSYKEIAGVLDVPVGTVMSRLARARSLLIRDLGAGRTAERTMP
jgi:RNA polymerase sigma-70 factor (ECF subfamily)